MGLEGTYRRNAIRDAIVAIVSRHRSRCVYVCLIRFHVRSAGARNSDEHRYEEAETEGDRVDELLQRYSGAFSMYQRTNSALSKGIESHRSMHMSALMKSIVIMLSAKTNLSKEGFHYDNETKTNHIKPSPPPVQPLTVAPMQIIVIALRICELNESARKTQQHLTIIVGFSEPGHRVNDSHSTIAFLSRVSVRSWISQFKCTALFVHCPSFARHFHADKLPLRAMFGVFSVWKSTLIKEVDY